MARYSKSASGDVKGAMKRRKTGTLKSGRGGKTVKSKKQAIASDFRRPDSQSLLRYRKPHTYQFKDDGMISNHPRWPLIIYKSVVSCRSLSIPRRCLKSCSSVTAGEARGVTASTTTPIIIRESTRSSASHGAAVECDLEEATDALSRLRQVT